ncbi:MAG: MBOAT family protein, partial [Erysipelotrichaceae bacterium]
MINYKKNKLLLGIEIIYYILALCFFKYNHFFISDSIVMPLGLSFYSFKIISYLFDIYRGDCPCEKNII